MEKEIRVQENDVEIRKLDSGEEVIEGYAVVFNTESRNLGGFTEVIMPDAFRTTDMTDVVATFNHNYDIILGRTPTTMTLNVDTRGVKYTIKPPQTTSAQDLMESIRRKDVRGSSFGFTITENGDTWEKPKEKNGLYKRIVSRVAKLWDAGPVVTPAYVSTDTSIARRSLGMVKDAEEREVNEMLEKERMQKELEESRRLRELSKLKAALAYHNDFEEPIKQFEQSRKKEIELQNRRNKHNIDRFNDRDE